MAKKSFILNAIFRYFYSLNFIIFKQIIIPQKALLFKRRGCARNDLTPGLSDLDILIVVENEEQIKSILTNYRKYSFFYPLIKDLEFFSIKIFENWKKSFDVRSIEFQIVNQGYLNIDLNKMSKDEKLTLDLSISKEIFNLYYKLYKEWIDKSNQGFKQYNFNKLIIEILRALEFKESKKPEVFLRSRANLFNEVLIKKYENLEDLLENHRYMDLFEMIFLLINDHSQKQVSRLSLYIGSDLKEQGYNCYNYKKVYDLKIEEDFKKAIKEEKLPLTSSMFYTLKACGFQEHEALISIFEKLNNEVLRKLYAIRLYCDLVGGVVNNGSNQLFYYMMEDFFNFFKGSQEKFESIISIVLKPDNKTIVRLEKRIQIYNLFKRYFLDERTLND